jgi:hypothetical protein
VLFVEWQRSEIHFSGAAIMAVLSGALLASTVSYALFFAGFSGRPSKHPLQDL